MKPLGISVIGGGYWGRKVIREIIELTKISGQISLHSVVDSSPIALEQCEKEFGKLDYRLDYESILSDPDVSAVHLCSPNATHFAMASELLRRKKHVLVEKPLALRAQEAFELVRLAEANRRVLSVGHVHRFNNGVRALRQVVASGILGDIYYVRFRWTGLLPLQKDRDVITDLGPHPLDICNHVLGLWPTKVSCRGRAYRGGTNVDVAFITAEHEAGPDVNIELSWLDPEKLREVTIVGSDGEACLDCLDQKLVLQQSSKVETVQTSPCNTLREEIVHFGRCITHPLEPGYTNLSNGLLGANVVAILEAAHKSLYEEGNVRVQSVIAEELFAREQGYGPIKPVAG